MFVVDSEKEANLKVQSRSLRLKKLGLYEFSQKVKSGELEQFNIVIKADVQGSIEAIRTSLNNLNTDKDNEIIFSKILRLAATVLHRYDFEDFVGLELIDKDYLRIGFFDEIQF